MGKYFVKFSQKFEVEEMDPANALKKGRALFEGKLEGGLDTSDFDYAVQFWTTTAREDKPFFRKDKPFSKTFTDEIYPNRRTAKKARRIKSGSPRGEDKKSRKMPGKPY